MLQSTSTQSAVRRFARSRRGAVNMDLVFGAALTLVIVAALTLTVYYGFIGESKPVGDEDPDVHVECTKCSETFTIPKTEYGPHLVKFTANGPMLDCRVCNAKASAYMMTKCPSCGQFYVSDRTKKTSEDDICPHCGTDRTEWFKNN